MRHITILVFGLLLAGCATSKPEAPPVIDRTEAQELCEQLQGYFCVAR